MKMLKKLLTVVCFLFLVVFHELTHVLQDQNFHTDEMDRRARGNLGLRSTQLSLIEGNAT